MTRKRNPTGPELQRAYGALDRYKISRTYFIKTNQNDCDTLPPAQEAVDTETTVEVENDGTQQEEEQQQQEDTVAEDTANVSNQNSVVQIVEQSVSEYYEDYGKSATSSSIIKKNAGVGETTDAVVTDSLINRKKLIHESQIPVEIKSFKK